MVKLRTAVICGCIGIGELVFKPAYADVAFNGFGQVVVGSTLGNDRSFLVPSGYSGDPSFRPESLFGLQASAPLAKGLSATAQIVASGSGDNDFTPKFEWAYVSYTVSDNWSIKAGRQRIPFYRYSDYLEAGQAYQWIRPPVSVYQDYISNFDGISGNGYYELGDWSFQPGFYYGGIKNSFTSSGQTYDFDLRNFGGVLVDVTYNEWLDIRLSASGASKVTISNSALDPLADSVLANSFDIGPGGIVPANNAGAADNLVSRNDTAVFYSAGINIDKDNFLIGGEYITYRQNNSVIPRAHSYYVNAGYRFGKFTPMLTYGHSQSEPSTKNLVGQVDPNSQCPIGVAADGSVILASCKSVVQAAVDATTDTSEYFEAGFRYDLTASTALKLDFTRHLHHNPQPGGGGSPDNANLVSAGFVFVF